MRKTERSIAARKSPLRHTHLTLGIMYPACHVVQRRAYHEEYAQRSNDPGITASLCVAVVTQCRRRYERGYRHSESLTCGYEGEATNR